MIDVLEYRGYKIEFKYNEEDQYFYTDWENECINFGLLNNDYKDDMKLIIDDKLDTIHKFENIKAKLKYFDNAGFRDIELLFGLRVIKIYPLKQNQDINMEVIIKDAEKILEKF